MIKKREWSGRWYKWQVRKKEMIARRNERWEWERGWRGCGRETAERRVKWWSEWCDKEAFEGSSQMLGLLSSALLEPLRYLNLACLSPPLCRAAALQATCKPLWHMIHSHGCRMETHTHTRAQTHTHAETAAACRQLSAHKHFNAPSTFGCFLELALD